MCLKPIDYFILFVAIVCIMGFSGCTSAEPKVDSEPAIEFILGR